MSWQWLAFINVLSLSTANLFSRMVMKDDKSDPIGYAIIFQFILGLFVLLFALSLNKLVLPDNLEISRLLMSGCLWAGSTVFSFYAIKKLSAGEVTILLSSGSMVSILLGILLLKETLTIKMVLGIVLVLLSVLLVSIDKLQFTSRSGVFFALSAALFSGIAVVNDALILKSYEAFTFTTIMCFLPGAILLIFFTNNFHRAVSNINPKFTRDMMLLGFVYSIQAVSYYLAFQKGAPVSLLSPIARSSVVLTVVLAAIFLKERLGLTKKMIAAGIVTTGVLMLG